MKRSFALLLPLLLVVGLAACGDDDDEKDATPASTSSSTTTTTEAPSTSSTTEAAVEEGAPATLALEWVRAIADGDDAAAIALTSPRSMEEIGGEAGWAEIEIPLAEGWGAWGHAEGIEVVTADIADGVWAATFHGEIAQEGPPAESWSTLMVVETDDGLRVEPFLDLGNVELDPETGASVEPTHTFAAFVLAGRDVTLLVDGEVVDSSTEGADGDQQRVFADHTMDPGLHGFAVVVSNDTGVMARSAVYTVPND